MEDISTTIKYRADIDGLRSIAVLAVLAYHFFPKELKGGFVGVDIFFVISGYLVTSILYKNVNEKKFSFLQFYYKRIKRLFPSLILVLFFTFLAGWIFLVANEFLILGKHVLSASLFSSNFLLYSESGYFDKSSELKPLLHIWSLCIEEQFYLIWPFIIYFLGKINRITLFLVLVLILMTSWKLNVHFTKDYQVFSFYLLPTRLWELAIGGVASFIDDSIPNSFLIKNKILSKINKTIIMKLLRTGLALWGLYLIAHSFHFLTEDKNFPGELALPPVMGTVFIILAGRESYFNKFLANRFLVYIGLISYPLYLWHWPLISFANIITINSVGKPEKFILLLTSFLLAILTYELIEKKIKKFSIQNRVIFPIGISLLLIGLAGGIVWKLDGLPFRYKDIERVRETSKSFLPTTKESKICQKKLLDVELCSISKIEKAPTVVLIGDSHANHLYPGLRKYFDDKGENILLLAKSGISPLYKVKNLGNPNPKANFEDIFKFIKATPSIHTVIISSFWGNYYDESGVQVGDILYKNSIEDILNPKEARQNIIFEKSFKRTIDYILGLKKRLIVFYDIPALPFHLEKCLPRPFNLKPANCEFPLNDQIKKQLQYRNVMMSILSQDKTVQTFDLLPKICPKDLCSVKKDKIILYSDDFHLSSAGAREILKGFSI